ncbi:MAG: ScyD/ScyE family protein [Chitinophagaceae bacterium]|nr:ScyD/ScyE family protein [Chitinophagaceae bacterium]
MYFKKVFLFPIFIIFLFTACKKETSKSDLPFNTENSSVKKGDAQPATVSVYYEGLISPRGLEFGPNGNLYVAEAGNGGPTSSTMFGCEQVPFPIGPYMGSPTGARISMITPGGVRTTITDQLPTSRANEIIGGDAEGVADVAFVGNTLYAVIAGGGCSHGVPSVPNQVIKVNQNGSWSTVANLSSWLQNHPVKNPEEDDFEPDGTPYSMVNVKGDLYVIEPNHGDLIKVTTGGDITRVVDISASQGHIVPTAMAYHGNFFVGNLHPFPIVEGSSKILKINPGGQVKDWATGLTTILGLAFDQRDRLYVLENTVVAFSPNPLPGLGQIVRIEPNGNKVTIATGLSLPTGMTMGPDGNLYVSNKGFGPPILGPGQILKVTLNN